MLPGIEILNCSVLCHWLQSLDEPRSVQATLASVLQAPVISKGWEPGLKWEQQGKGRLITVTLKGDGVKVIMESLPCPIVGTSNYLPNVPLTSYPTLFSTILLRVHLNHVKNALSSRPLYIRFHPCIHHYLTNSLSVITLACKFQEGHDIAFLFISPYPQTYNCV